MVITDSFAVEALAGFALAKQRTDLMDFLCYRAIENLRQAFGENEDEQNGRRNLSWEALKTALRFDAALVDAIRIKATAARHGARQSSDYVDAGTTIRTTHVLIDQYLRFLEGGRSPLDPRRFPQLAAPTR